MNYTPFQRLRILAGSVRRLAPVVLWLATSAVVAQDSENPSQRDARMTWWRDARFGLFIHWGLYSIPAGEWNGNTNHAEWIRTTAQIPLTKYDEFVSQFNPVKFNAEAWVLAAKAAGMKYIVITSKHHDGFALFDSKVSGFDVMATPFKRDIMAELAAACRTHDMKMCWYHSIMDWHHPDYLPRREWEQAHRPANDADFERYIPFLHGQVTELLNNYGDIGVMWFDGEWESTWSHAHGKALYELCRSLQPNVIINNRVDVGRGGAMSGMTAEGEFCGDFGTPEQEIPATGIPGVDWETCMTMNDHWGYNTADHNWKSPGELIQKLVDIASKGGNFLLNIGPTAEGEFPPESLERLRDIGAWMSVNGEAIYGTSASPFAHLDWGRCTMKRSGSGSTMLYLHVLDWPDDRTLIVPGVGSDAISGHLLCDRSTSVPVSRHGTDLHIALPAVAPDENASVIALEFPGDPTIHLPPKIAAPADVFVQPIDVTMVGPTAEMQVRYTLDGSEPTMLSPIARGAVTIADELTLKARTFIEGKPASAVASRRFTRLVPRQAEVVAQAIPGVRCAVYHGRWDRLPDFRNLEPDRVESLTAIALPDGEPEQDMARIFSGWITVPESDVYEFALTSDDGSRLLIGEQAIIENDGLHVALERRGIIALARGSHRFEIHYFNRTGESHCTLRLARLGRELQPINPQQLLHTIE